jgi:hypothetical protein
MCTNDIVDIGTETASYTVPPLGTTVSTVYASLSATPPTPLIPMLFTSNGSRALRFAPTTAYVATDSPGGSRIVLYRPHVVFKLYDISTRVDKSL